MKNHEKTIKIFKFSIKICDMHGLVEIRSDFAMFRVQLPTTSARMWNFTHEIAVASLSKIPPVFSIVKRQLFRV